MVSGAFELDEQAILLPYKWSITKCIILYSVLFFKYSIQSAIQNVPFNKMTYIVLLKNPTLNCSAFSPTVKEHGGSTVTYGTGSSS